MHEPISDFGFVIFRKYGNYDQSLVVVKVVFECQEAQVSPSQPKLPHVSAGKRGLFAARGALSTVQPTHSAAAESSAPG